MAALSAQASDMSGWLLMGLPGAIYLCGIGEMWVGIGLAIGSYFAWLVIAKRLRQYSEKANNSITMSEYFSNRFRDTKGILSIVSGLIILFFFTIYVASGFNAAGKVFEIIFPQVEYIYAMLIGVVVIVGYTFLGGFKAVSWTDFFQAILMLFAIILVPLVALGTVEVGGWDGMVSELEGLFDGTFLDPMYSGGTKLTAIGLISLLAWGLGYLGMPHILARYMALKDPEETKVARRVSLIWIVLALSFAILIGVVGRAYDPTLVGAESETIFLVMSGLFPPLVMGLLFAGLMAAIMSTADSQLLVASGSVSNDIYAKITKKKLSDNTLVWISRGAVIVIAIIAAVIASDKTSTIMGLVSYAWAGFGAAFGPIVVLSLFWKRLNMYGALSGMIVGFLTVILWNTFLASTGIYEIIPGFIFAMVAAIVVSLATKEPSEEVYQEFDEYSKM